MNSELIRGVLKDDVAYTVLTPAGWTATERLPLILLLHGANSSSEFLAALQPLIDGLWADGALPRSVVACASTPTVGGFYLGEWEDLVATDFPALLAAEFGIDERRMSLIGSSMGGYGALKIAFADPGRWQAVAAIAPALLPVPLRARNTIGVLAELAAATTDPSARVLDRLHANADAIRASGLPIFLRVGDRDVFKLQDGTEELHRALWDLDIGHEYHLVLDGDHLGPEAMAAQRAALIFLGSARAEKTAADLSLEAAWLRWAAEGRQGAPPQLDVAGASASVALRVLLEPELTEAARQDPTAARRYGIL